MKLESPLCPVCGKARGGKAGSHAHDECHKITKERHENDRHTKSGNGRYTGRRLDYFLHMVGEE